jgi:hypothetical protein
MNAEGFEVLAFPRFVSVRGEQPPCVYNLPGAGLRVLKEP